MYGEYSVQSIDKTLETLETLNDMHNRTSLLEAIVNGSAPLLIRRILGNPEGPANPSGPALFTFDLQLYLTHIKEEHTAIYEELLNNFHKLMKGIEKLSKGYLPSELFPPSALYKLT